MLKVKDLSSVQMLISAVQQADDLLKRTDLTLQGGYQGFKMPDSLIEAHHPAFHPVDIARINAGFHLRKKIMTALKEYRQELVQEFKSLGIPTSDE